MKINKNDTNDAEAIVEGASRPLSIHRVRSRLIKNRAALINETRGLNLEYGIAIPQGALKIKSHLRSIIDDKANELTLSSRKLIQANL